MSGPLTHSPAEIIQQLLIKWQQGSTFTDAVWPVYSTNEPSSTDDVITVYDTEGMSDGRSMIDGETWEHWGIQVRIRSSEHREGWVRANRIRDFFARKVNQALVTMPDDSSMYIVWCLAGIGPVLPIGKQTPQTKRSIFTINCKTPIREVLPVEP